MLKFSPRLQHKLEQLQQLHEDNPETYSATVITKAIAKLASLAQEQLDLQTTALLTFLSQQLGLTTSSANYHRPDQLAVLGQDSATRCFLPLLQVSLLHKLPLTLSGQQLWQSFFDSYQVYQHLANVTIVGVTKQENRRVGAEKFLDALTLTEYAIKEHSQQQNLLLDLRDKAHAYANLKRKEQQERELLKDQDILSQIAGFGAATQAKVKKAYPTNGDLVQLIQTAKDPVVELLKETSLTSKQAHTLVDYLRRNFLLQP